MDVMIPSGARPLAPSGLGSTALQSSQPARPLSSTTPPANMAKRVTGWGSRLPSHSTTSRNLVNQVRCAASSSSVGESGLISFVIYSVLLVPVGVFRFESGNTAVRVNTSADKPIACKKKPEWFFPEFIKPGIRNDSYRIMHAAVQPGFPPGG
jgi:hypothetical protein